MPIRLTRMTDRHDGTPEGTWAVGDPFEVASVAAAEELIRTGRAKLADGETMPRAKQALERADLRPSESAVQVGPPPGRERGGA